MKDEIKKVLKAQKVVSAFKNDHEDEIKNHAKYIVSKYSEIYSKHKNKTVTPTENEQMLINSRCVFVNYFNIIINKSSIDVYGYQHLWGGCDPDECVILLSLTEKHFDNEWLEKHFDEWETSIKKIFKTNEKAN